jgi:hypothetical protein
MAAEAFDVFGRGGPRQPNNIIKIKPRGARANSSPLLIGVSHRFRVYGRQSGSNSLTSGWLVIQEQSKEAVSNRLQTSSLLTVEQT